MERNLYFESFCSICGTIGPFKTPYIHASLRETVCPQCHSTRRTRDCVRVLLKEACGREDIPLKQALPLLKDKHILEFQAQGPLHDVLSQLPHYTCCEYYESINSGGTHTSGTLCQDLFCLTFADASFDFVITQDVMEHVEQPWHCFSEIQRVLKQGGKHIFTVPIHEGHNTFTRIIRNDDGTLYYTAPEVHHGDPISSKGSLVFTDFGDDLIKLLCDQSLDASQALHIPFYTPQEIPIINTEKEVKRYRFLTSKGKSLQFFIYNSNVFTTTQLDKPNNRSYRIQYTPTTNMFQTDTMWYKHFEQTLPKIHSLRSENIFFYGRTSYAIDVILEKEKTPCAALLMIEMCWGDLPCFIFPSCFKDFEESLNIIAEQLFTIFKNREKTGEKIYENIFLDGSGYEKKYKSSQEQTEPAITSYYTLIPHIRRYAFIREHINSYESVFDIGCGCGYGLAMLSPKKGLGIDLSNYAINQAKNYYPYSQLQWIKGAIEEANPQEKYDIIINFENIEHLDDPTPLIELLKKSTHQNSKIFISIPNPTFHGKTINCYHKIDYSFSIVKALLEYNFTSIKWFWQSSSTGDLAQRFLIKEGLNEDAEFWIAICSKPILQKKQEYDVSIIIPVFNKWEYTEKALTAIYKQNTIDIKTEIIIIDNASSDETQSKLSALGEKIVYYRNQKNIGFAKASNQGAILSRGKLLIFLNNDTEVQKGWLKALTEELNNNPNTGVCGGKLLYPNDTIQHAGVAIGRDCIPYHIHRSLHKNHPLVQERRIYPIVTGACAAVRRKEFFDLGFFDEKFINGHEDIDLCLRYKEQGQNCIYRPDCVVIHHESVSDGRMNSCENNLKRTINKHRYQLVQDDFKYLFRQDSIVKTKDPLNFAIKIGVPDRTINNWGDIYYAECLAKYLTKAGHNCVIHYLSEWGNEDSDIDVVIHLKGLSRYYPKPWNINIMWMLNHPELHTTEELESYDAICVASAHYSQVLKKQLSIPVFYLPQATDPEHFYPITNVEKKYDLVFVGNNNSTASNKLRATIAWNLPTKYKFALWGYGWEDYVPEEYIKNKFLPWEQLPSVYNAAHIVLNDHQKTMASYGFVNNRTLDALVCGTLVISDSVFDMKNFLDVPQCSSKNEMHKLVNFYLANPNKAKNLVKSLRQKILKQHTFEQRVQQLEVFIDNISTPSVVQRISDSKNRIQDISYRRQGPLVSILMATKNRKKLLKQAIASIQKQQYTNWELCLTCDGGEPVDDLICSLNDERIHLSHLSENKGKGYAINYAFERSCGEYIAYLDDDDIWYPDHLERLMLMVREINGIKMAYSDAESVVLDVDKNYQETDRRLKYYNQVTIDDIMEFNSVTGITLIHHRDMFLEAGKFDEKLKALIDFDMWKRLFALAYPYHISRITAEYFFYQKNKNSTQITSLYKNNIISYAVQRLRIMSKKLNLPKDSPLHLIQKNLKKKSIFEYAVLKATQYIQQGDEKKAIPFLKLAQAKYVYSVEGLRSLAKCYLLKKDYENSYTIFMDTLKKSHLHISDILYALLSAIELRDEEKIIKCIEITAPISDDFPEATKKVYFEYIDKASIILSKNMRKYIQTIKTLFKDQKE